ncbi:alpha/beta fold hydrolase [Desulfobacula sp.]
MGTLTANQTKIAYETSGSGETGTVILIRGQGTQMTHWPESFYQAFTYQGFLTVRFDNRDTGLSEKFDHISDRELEILKQTALAGKEISPPYTLYDMALDVIGLMDGLGIPSAHIVGISMGGYISQIIAAKYASRVLTMTSIMSGSGSLDPRLMERLWLTRKSRESFIEEWVEYVQQFGSKKYFEGDDHSRQQAAAAYDRCYSPDGANRQLFAIASMKNGKELAKSITIPTLVVHGAGDLLLPPSRGRETAKLIPGATFKLIDGMGHDIPPGLGKPLASVVLEHIQSTIKFNS